MLTLKKRKRVRSKTMVRTLFDKKTRLVPNRTPMHKNAKMHLIQKREIKRRLPSKSSQEPKTRNQPKSFKRYNETVKTNSKQKLQKTQNVFGLLNYNGRKEISRRQTKTTQEPESSRMSLNKGFKVLKPIVLLS